MTHLLVLILLVAAAPLTAHAQFGDPTAVDPELNELTHPRPDHSVDVAPPVVLTVVGGVTALGGVVTLLAAGYQSFDSVEDGAPEQGLIWAGTLLVGVGVPLLFAGLYWLIDRLSAEPEEAPDPLLSRDPPGLIRF